MKRPKLSLFKKPEPAPPDLGAVVNRPTCHAGQLRQAIANFDGPPLAASTIKAKGFETQLIDTGVMSNSVDHAVHAGKKED